MNWIKENKFVAGLIGITVVICCALAFLLLSAKGSYDEASTAYEDQARELDRLQKLAPFPDDNNLKALKEQEKEQKQLVSGLAAKLSATEIPLESLSGAKFQDMLKETVLRVSGKAAAKGMALPVDKFYMGFDQYQSEPPREDAAPLLGRQLKAMEFAVTLLIDNGASALTKIDRESLPQESGKGKEPKGAKGVEGSVSRHFFDLGFTGEQNAFRSVLNKLVESKTQFFIPRRIEVKNEKDKGPARLDPVAAAAEAAAAAAAASTPIPAEPLSPGVAPMTVPTGVPPAAPNPTGAPPLSGKAAPAEIRKYLVGEEKLDVLMRIDIVDFAQPKAK